MRQPECVRLCCSRHERPCEPNAHRVLLQSHALKPSSDVYESATICVRRGPELSGEFILYCDQQMHNCFTNYHTPTCFDTIVSSSGSFVINTCTVHLLLFCTMTNKWTIVSQIITLLHVSTLSCHPQAACNQYLYRASLIILYYAQQMHNYFTNYHNPTCFDTIVSPSGSL